MSKAILGITIAATVLVAMLLPLAPHQADAAMEHEHEDDPTTILVGKFVGADFFHNAEGIAKVLAVNDGQIEHRILRLENFKSTNGPDLYVYLSKEPRSISAGYVDLGRLKGNIGNQNYHIPDDVNLDDKYVLIWCKQFSVLFGYAELKPA